MLDNVLTALPVYNEAAHLTAVLDEVLHFCNNVLVVDDGSTDRASSTRPTPEPRKPQADDEVDLSALVAADAVEGSAVERLTKAFPGAALVDPD